MEYKDKILNYIDSQFHLVPHLIEQATEKGNFKTRFSFLRLRQILVNFIGDKNYERLVILPGLRGVGKTTLLYQLYRLINRNNMCKKENNLYLSCDVLSKQGFELKDVIDVYEDKILGIPFEKIKEKVVIMIDEAHYCENWGDIVKILYDRSKNILIFVSGSSSLPLELSTDVVRRSRIERVYPLSFLEYLILKGNGFLPYDGLKDDLRKALFNSKDSKDAFLLLEKVIMGFRNKIIPISPNYRKEFEDFIIFGGFPFTMLQKQDIIIFQKIIAILEKIIYQDLLTYSSLSKETLNKIFPILNILSDTVSPISFETLSNNQENIKKTQVFEIISNLNKAGVLEGIPIEGPITKVERNSRKYMFSVPSIRSALIWNQGKFKRSSEVLGKLLEDAVFNTLKREQIFSKNVIGISYPESQNSDFIIKTSSGKIVIECCWGDKDVKGIIKVMKEENASFGIIVSDNGEKFLEEENILYIPKEIFLLL